MPICAAKNARNRGSTYKTPRRRWGRPLSFQESPLRGRCPQSPPGRLVGHGVVMGGNGW